MVVGKHGSIPMFPAPSYGHMYLQSQIVNSLVEGIRPQFQLPTWRAARLGENNVGWHSRHGDRQIVGSGDCSTLTSTKIAALLVLQLLVWLKTGFDNDLFVRLCPVMLSQSLSLVASSWMLANLDRPSEA